MMDTVQMGLWIAVSVIAWGAAFMVGFKEGCKDERKAQESKVQEFLWNEVGGIMYYEACWKARTIVTGEYRRRLYAKAVIAKGDTAPSPMRAHDSHTCTCNDHKVTDFEDLRFGEEE